MDKLFIEVATKVGGVLAFLGLFVGGFLWYPKCDARVFARECRNIMGPVSLNDVGQPNIVGLTATGCAFGAVVGAVIGLLIGAVWPSTKKDLELN
jgi:hypothetical protein